MKKVRFVLVLPILAGVLTGCSLEAQPSSTALITAVNYEDKTGITYQSDDEFWTPGRPSDDKGGGPRRYKERRRISKGDYKPTWAAVQNRLGISLLEHQGAAFSGEKKSVAYFRDNWLQKQYADITMGTVAAINNYSVAGSKETILDLKPYLDETKFTDDGEIDPNHVGRLPHFAKFLHDNPSIVMSILTAKHSHPEKGAIYYVPYCDGFNDLEKLPNIRADYIQRLLDDTIVEDNPKNYWDTNPEVLIKGNKGKLEKHYIPFCVDSENNAPAYIVEVPKVDPNTGAITTEEIAKKPVENIIVRQNKLIEAGEASSKKLAEDFRKYIDERYEDSVGNSNPFTNHYSDLFLGQNACYDADEMIALMRLMKVSGKTIFGEDCKKEMVPFLPRQFSNQYSTTIYNWAAQMFGVRGLESRNGYLYLRGNTNYGGDLDQYDKVHDCRGDEELLTMIEKLQQIYKEGLILQNFDTANAAGTSSGKFADELIIGGGNDYYAGFMTYDFFLTTGSQYNRKVNKEHPEKGSVVLDDDGYVDHYWKAPQYAENQRDYLYRPILPPVTAWDVDGDGQFKPNENIDGYFQFSESWRAVKTSAMCLNAKLAKNPKKLEVAFKLIDYVFSKDGQILFNFGPYEDGYIYDYGDVYDPDNLLNHDADIDAADDWYYYDYLGDRIPVITPNAANEHLTKNSYARTFIGATLPFGYVKMCGVDYELADGKEPFKPDLPDDYIGRTQGIISQINNSVNVGTFRHVLSGKEELNPGRYNQGFYHVVPSAFFLTKGQTSGIAELLDKNKLGSMFTDNDQTNFNIWDSYVMGTKSSIAPELKDYLKTVNGAWQLPKLVAYYQDAYEIMAEPKGKNGGYVYGK